MNIPQLAERLGLIFCLWSKELKLKYQLKGSSFIFSRVSLTLDTLASLVAETIQNLPAMQETGSIPELRRSPAGGNGSPLQYSSLENPMDREAWRATIHGDTQSWSRLTKSHFHTFINWQKDDTKFLPL